MTDVLLVEDDAAFADALHAQLTADGRFGRVQHAPDVQAGKQALLQQSPDLLVLDLDLPDGSGLELLADVDQKTRVVVLTVFGDESRVLDALSQGVDGYLLKDDLNIADAFVAIAEGAAAMNARVARYLLDEWRRQALTSKSASPLTPRETETLEWLSQGFSYRETAQRMAISDHTVGDHVKRIYRKLAVNSRAEAVYEALRLGYIVAPERPST
ncbi:MAG: response regulator transcription factor [Pseudomonadota bacterium]